MYRIVQNRRAWWWVVFPGVTEEGRVVENKIELRFTIHDEDAFVQLLNEAAELPKKAAVVVDAEEDEEKRKILLSTFYAEFVQRIATDWRGVGAENGEPLKWEQENIRQLMAMPNVFAATVKAFVACRSGEKDTRAGN